MIGLTPHLRMLKNFIRGYQAEHGVMPAYTEMAAAMALKSRSGIFRMMDELEERGHVRCHRVGNHRLPRAFELIEDSNICAHCGHVYRSPECLAEAARAKATITYSETPRTVAASPTTAGSLSPSNRKAAVVGRNSAEVVT